MVFDRFVGDERPLSWAVHFWPVLLSAWVAGLAATAVCKKVALKLGIVDRPDDLVKTHKEPVAYLGGIGILCGLVTGIFAGLYLLRADAVIFAGVFKMLLGILVGAGIACLIGVIDDIFDIKPLQKILGQVVAAAALILVGVMPSIKHLIVPFGWSIPPAVEWALAAPVVVFFVLGATNSLNLLDGLDGLCGGVTAIITVAMLLLAVHLGTWNFSPVGDRVRLIVCLSLVGGVCGFLPFNRHPAKIFMGDAGSMLLGFTCAALMILFAEKTPRWWFASIVVFGLPILDTAVALVRRWLNGRPLFKSDRGHIYDQMVDRGIGLTRTVAICYGLAALYAVIGLAMSQFRTRYALAVYVVVMVVSAGVVWRKGYLKMEGHRGAIRQDSAPPA